MEREEERQIENLSERHRAFFVYGILNKWAPNNSFLQTGVGFEEKLKLALGFELTISVSALQKGDLASEMWAA